MMAKKQKTSRTFVKRPMKKDKEPAPIALPDNKGKRLFSLIKGMHDILPKEEKYWRALYHAAEGIATYFQFGRIETPLLEEASLFIRSVGRGTDVVDKEMYVFEDRDGTRVALRPEPTASIARAFIQHGLWNQAQPIKVWIWGPMFRHDRPQAGRYRQFFQCGFETLGARDPSIDAELILVATNICKDLGIATVAHINTIGTKEERSRYVNELANYYRSKRGYLCEDCKLRLSKNPLRLLDCKAEGCQPVKESAPQIIDWLEPDSKNYFMKVLEYLDELGITYVLTPALVRGLDYYTHTVFEIYEAVAGETTAQSALIGGGRYDGLVSELGGPPTPAAGFGLGVERLVAVLKQRAEASAGETKSKPSYDVFFAQLGEDARRRALKLINDLRSKGISISYNFAKQALKNQLELANGLKVPYVVIVGQKEVQDQTVIVRDMESGVQEIVPQKKLEAALNKKLGKV